MNHLSYSEPQPLNPARLARRNRMVKGLAIVSIGAGLTVGLAGCETTDSHALDGAAKGISGAYFKTEPLWVQDFGGDPDGKLDSTDWNVYTGEAPGNHEAQLYVDSPDNLVLDKPAGVLRLKALAHPEGGFDFTSTRIDTENKIGFQYGKFEVVAKIPEGVGTWPAIWLEPTDRKYEKKYPLTVKPNYYIDGEIDIMEEIGSQPNHIFTTVHYLDESLKTLPYENQGATDVPAAEGDFHKYAVEWSPTDITFIIDGKAVFSVDKKANYTFKTWPYDQKYYFIINLALGGDWAGQDPHYAKGVDPAALPAEFDIQSIKYYEYVPQH